MPERSLIKNKTTVVQKAHHGSLSQAKGSTKHSTCGSQCTNRQATGVSRFEKAKGSADVHWDTKELRKLWRG